MAISLLRLNRELKWYRWSLYAIIGNPLLSYSSQTLHLLMGANLTFLAHIGFVIAYSIQAIAWLFVYCTPYSGWWEFQWMNPFDPRCHDFSVFVDLVYWNICESFPLYYLSFKLAKFLTATSNSLQYHDRRVPGSSPHPYHLAPQNEASGAAIRDRNSKSWILVSHVDSDDSYPHLRDRASANRLKLKCHLDGNFESGIHAHYWRRSRRHL